MVRSTYRDAIVTVEGFPDPAGSAAYSQDLGQRRAKAVRYYLVSNGMADAQVRAASYGAARNRRVRTGATEDAGRDNVALRWRSTMPEAGAGAGGSEM